VSISILKSGELDIIPVDGSIKPSLEGIVSCQQVDDAAVIVNLITDVEIVKYVAESSVPVRPLANEKPAMYTRTISSTSNPDRKQISSSMLDTLETTVDENCKELHTISAIPAVSNFEISINLEFLSKCSNKIEFGSIPLLATEIPLSAGTYRFTCVPAGISSVAVNRIELDRRIG
jgi:hypothetical protein